MDTPSWVPFAVAALAGWLATSPLAAQDKPTPEPISVLESAGFPPGAFKKPVAKPRNRMPTYTAEAREACIRGVVILSMVIDERGRVDNVKVRKPLSHGLTEKAVEAAQRFRFKPARLNGKPVSVWYHSTFNFQPPTACRMPRPGERPIFTRSIDDERQPPDSASPEPPLR